jgi:hypothetical protein
VRVHRKPRSPRSGRLHDELRLDEDEVDDLRQLRKILRRIVIGHILGRVVERQRVLGWDVERLDQRFDVRLDHERWSDLDLVIDERRVTSRHWSVVQHE